MVTENQMFKIKMVAKKYKSQAEGSNEYVQNHDTIIIQLDPKIEAEKNSFTVDKLNPSLLPFNIDTL